MMTRLVRYLPHRRYAVMKGMANFILTLPDEFPLLIQTSLGRLVELMQLWRSCLAEEALKGDVQNGKRPGLGGNTSQASPFHQSGDPTEFRTSEMDAIGLIFLCSVDVQIRRTALELLRHVRALKNDIRDLSINERSDYKFRYEAEPIFIIDVLEENGVSSHIPLPLYSF